jgi:hypothetical protein
MRTILGALLFFDILKTVFDRLDGQASLQGLGIMLDYFHSSPNRRPSSRYSEKMQEYPSCVHVGFIPAAPVP